MRVLGRWRTLAGAAVLVGVLVFSASSALSQGFHGIAFAKTCEDPTTVGSPLECRFQIANFDTGNNSEVIFSLSDTVNSAGGAVGSGELLPTLELVFSGPTLPTCVGGSGSGTAGDPYVGATSCTLPVLASTITTSNFSHYTVTAADFGLPMHRLTDQGSLGWRDNCDVDPVGCNTNDQIATAPGGTTVEKLASSTATDIHNGAHQVVTTVAVGSTVHDLVSVTGQPGQPNPTGNVNVDWFLNGDCTGTPAANSGSVGPLDGSGQFDATGFAFTVNATGARAFLGHYEGDGLYLPSDGPCEPLQVVDANIQITPAMDTNAVGTNHVLTITVNAVNGTLGDGTATASIVSGPGSFVGSPSCNYTGGGATASCTVTITSAATGTTVVSATSDIPVDGQSITRTTGTAANTAAGGSDNASKKWVDAFIEITPATATNAVGTNHVLTITVHAVNGTLGDGTATASIVSGPGSFVGSPSCNYTGGGATASCTVTITSAATGTTVVSATSDIPVDGQSITRTTGTAANTTAGGSGNASKKWVDAFIEISPAMDTNAVGTNHVLTITVHAVNGTLGDGSATASIVGGPGSFVGSPSCNYTGGGATASCTVTITSAATGTTVVSATSDIPVDGQSITRTTGTAANTAAGGSGNASKKWVDAFIEITPAMDTNPVGTNHVLTITVNAINGTLGDGTATASIVSGPGSFVGSPSCNYTGGGATASCTVTITSATAGTTVVSATSDIPVDGQSITRTTGTAANTAAGGSGNASKLWVDVNIQITPAMDTNAVGTNHVLTITVNALGATLGNGTATASIVSGPGSFVGSPSCNYTGGGATASCTVTITSTATGTTVVSATSDIPVDGQSITRTTGTAANTAAGGSGNASKKWVDAFIEITPATATNAVGTNHVLTITVHAVNGTLGDGSATASIVSGPGSFVGSPSCNYTGGGATASCTVTITSGATGTTVVSATSDIPVDGQSITRTTGTAANTAAGGSGNASKKWVNANIQITPATATNPINTNHVLTITVNALNGTLGNGTATASIVSGPGSFVGSPSCNYTGGGATASCTVTITSAVAGTTVISATSDISVDGQSITRTTGTAANTAAGGSDNAEKNWEGGGGQITPTQVSCQDFIGGSAPTLDQINYSVSGGKIHQGINPGVFFYWTKITTTVPNQVVTTSQSNTSTNNSALFLIHQGWQRLYTGDCSSWTTGTQIAGGTAASFTVPTPGNYVIGIKYDVKSLAGTTPPVPDDITFDFSTSLGGSTGASVLLKKK